MYLSIQHCCTAVICHDRGIQEDDFISVDLQVHILSSVNIEQFLSLTFIHLGNITHMKMY